MRSEAVAICTIWMRVCHLATGVMDRYRWMPWVTHDGLVQATQGLACQEFPRLLQFRLLWKFDVLDGVVLEPINRQVAREYVVKQPPIGDDPENRDFSMQPIDPCTIGPLFPQSRGNLLLTCLNLKSTYNPTGENTIQRRTGGGATRYRV